MAGDMAGDMCALCLARVSCLTISGIMRTHHGASPAPREEGGHGGRCPGTEAPLAQRVAEQAWPSPLWDGPAALGVL